MIQSFRKKTVALAAVGVLCLGGGAYAATSGGAPTPLTGTITEKASDAAVAKFPGSTLVGIRSLPDGTFRAHVREADGTLVELTLDAELKVTATREGGRGHGGPGGRGGHGGPRRGVDVASLAGALGVTEAKLRAALEEVRPEKGERRDERAAAIAKALGTSTGDVRSVLEDEVGRGPGGPHGPRGDRGDLVAALAEKSGKAEAQVRKALDSVRADHGDRTEELAAALAKELGLDAAKVRKALEAARPSRRP